MSILVGADTRVVVQGFTGAQGTLHSQQMIAYGTKVVSGVTPGKGGMTHLGVPVRDTVAEAVSRDGANTSIIFVPAPFAADSVFEAAEAGVDLVVCITEGIPQFDMIGVVDYCRRNNVKLVGPNCPGVITPGQCKLGIMSPEIHAPGTIGVVSRSGTLTYEAVAQVTEAGYGQSSSVGIGGDPVPGMSFVDVLEMYQADDGTEAIIMIGEIGGTAEEEAAAYIKKHVSKPVVAYIAGVTAPPGRRMGHAGAIVSGGQGTAEAKITALEDAGVTTVRDLSVIGRTVIEQLKS